MRLFILLFFAVFSFAESPVLDLHPYRKMNNVELKQKGIESTGELIQLLEKQNPLIKKWMKEIKEDSYPSLSFEGMDEFTKSNFCVVFASECIKRRMWEEAILALENVKISECIDPGSYFYCKGTAEFMIGRKKEAENALNNLIVMETEDRYFTLAKLMLEDMKEWKENDLHWISRKMQEISDRLKHGKGGPITKKMQKEVLVRLDELIKEKENQQKEAQAKAQASKSDGEGRQGQAQGNQIQSPASESSLPPGIGEGVVVKREAQKIVKEWGNLPEKERAAALQALEAKVPEKYLTVIRRYTKAISDKTVK